MHKIVKQVINSGRFELADMLRKIDTKWMQGDLTDNEKDELVELAREKANPENSYAGLQKQVDMLFTRMAELEARIKELETVKPDESEDPENPDNPEVPEEPETPAVDEYPEYVAPTGAHDAHYAGYKCTFKGRKYNCIAPEGVAVVWDPDTYPAYWELVEETETN